MINTIKNIAGSLKNNITEFTRELIAIPSITGNEAQVIERIRKEMEKIRYNDIKIDEMGNLIGRIGNGDKILAIDGHVDTVEIGNPQNWKYNHSYRTFELKHRYWSSGSG